MTGTSSTPGEKPLDEFVSVGAPIDLDNCTRGHLCAGLAHHRTRARLVMYSDGLVERRGEAIDDGIDRLAKTLGRAGNAPASRIRAAMEWGDTHDDVTIVTPRRP